MTTELQFASLCMCQVRGTYCPSTTAADCQPLSMTIMESPENSFNWISREHTHSQNCKLTSRNHSWFRSIWAAGMRLLFSHLTQLNITSKSTKQENTELWIHLFFIPLDSQPSWYVSRLMISASAGVQDRRFFCSDSRWRLQAALFSFQSTA